MNKKYPELTADQRMLLEGLESRPELMNRFLSILAVTREPKDACKFRSADEVESLLIDEVRQLGREGLEGWAREVDLHAGQRCRNEDKSVKLREKKR